MIYLPKIINEANAIELLSTANHLTNNYGFNWAAATESIEGFPLLGTPGK